MTKPEQVSQRIISDLNNKGTNLDWNKIVGKRGNISIISSLILIMYMEKKNPQNTMYNKKVIDSSMKLFYSIEKHLRILNKSLIPKTYETFEFASTIKLF